MQLLLESARGHVDDSDEQDGAGDRPEEVDDEPTQVGIQLGEELRLGQRVLLVTTRVQEEEVGG